MVTVCGRREYADGMDGRARELRHHMLEAAYAGAAVLYMLFREEEGVFAAGGDPCVARLYMSRGALRGLYAGGRESSGGRMRRSAPYGGGLIC
jgi:hypothetical protein